MLYDVVFKSVVFKVLDFCFLFEEFILIVFLILIVVICLVGFGNFLGDVVSISEFFWLYIFVCGWIVLLNYGVVNMFMFFLDRFFGIEKVWNVFIF